MSKSPGKGRGKCFPTLIKANANANRRIPVGDFTIDYRLLPCLLYHLKTHPVQCTWNLRVSNLSRIGIVNNGAVNERTILQAMRQQMLDSDLPDALKNISRVFLTDSQLLIYAFTSFVDNIETENHDQGPATMFSTVDDDDSLKVTVEGIPLTTDILQNALCWLYPPPPDPTCQKLKPNHAMVLIGKLRQKNVSSMLQLYLTELENLLGHFEPENIKNFITQHTWNEKVPSNGSVTDERKFIINNLPKQTRIIAHVIDGLHRTLAFDHFMQTENLLPKREQCVFRGFMPDSIDEDFAKFMKDISQKSQEVSSGVHPHGPREFLTATMSALEKACEAAQVDFLFPYYIDTSLFAVDATGHFKTKDQVEIWKSLQHLADEQQKEELLKKIEKPVQVTEVVIQLWLERIALIIRDVLSNSYLKNAVFPEFDIAEMLKKNTEFWHAFFKPAFSDKKNIDFGYFFVNKKSTLANFLQHACYQYDQVIKNNHAIEIVQLLLWSRLSSRTHDILRRAFSDYECKSCQLQTEKPTLTKAKTYRWISCMVQSIASSVYFSKLVWSKSGYLQTKKRLFLPDDLYNFSLLMSSIERNVKFFVSQGTNPVGPFYFVENMVQGKNYDFLSYVTWCHTHNMANFFSACLSDTSLWKKRISNTLGGDWNEQFKNVRKTRSIDCITNFFVTIVDSPPKSIEFTTSICQYSGVPLFMENDGLFALYSESEIGDAVIAINEVVPVQEEDDLSITSSIHDTDRVQYQGNDHSSKQIVREISDEDRKELKQLMKDIRDLLPKKRILIDLSGEIGEEVIDLVERLSENKRRNKV
jgi:hypothetical protein